MKTRTVSHTPGPWDVVDCEVTTAAKPYRIVCNTANQYDERGEDEANARLIAAAPDLSEACRKAMWALMAVADDEFAEGRRGLCLDAFESCRAALAKAEA